MHRAQCDHQSHFSAEVDMPQGDKSAYTDRQKRKAEHIEEGYRERGISEGEAERRAWATVNKQEGGGRKSGSGRKRTSKKSSSRKSTSKRSSARKSTARKSSGRKSTAKRSSGRKSTSKRSSGRKSSSRGS
jgi:hypothetical protein